MFLKQNIGNTALPDLKQIGNTLLCPSFLSQSEYFWDVIAFKFGMAILFALSCLRSSFSALVRHIVVMGSYEEMNRITAKWSIAMMTHKQAFWNWAISKFPRIAMGSNWPVTVPCASICHANFPPSSASPKPTGINSSTFIYSVPEVVNYICSLFKRHIETILPRTINCKLLLIVILLSGFCFGQNSINNPASTSGLASSSSNVLPTVVSTGAVVVSGAGTTVTVTPPASIVNGNLLVAVLQEDGVTNPIWTPPAGWALAVSGCTTACAANAVSSANHKTNIAVFFRAASGESGSYIFTMSSSAGLTAAEGYITQLAGTTALDVSGTQTGNLATLTISALTPTTVNDLVLVVGHQNGSAGGVVQLATPGSYTKLIQASNSFAGTFLNGNGVTPAPIITAAQSGGAPATTDDFVAMAIAFSPSTTSTTTPFAANSSSGSATFGGLHVTGPAQFDTSVFVNTLGMPNGGSCTHTSPGLFQQTVSGYAELLLCSNSAGNLALDAEGHYTFISTFGGARGGPGLLVSSGLIESVSNDASQDLPMIEVPTSSNQLVIGCKTSAPATNPTCAQATQSSDIFYNTNLAKIHRMQIGDIDRFAVGDTKNLTSGVAATILSIPLAADQTAGGTVSWSALATDTVNHLNCSTSGTVEYSGENSAGVFVVNTSIIGTNATACTVTLTNTCTFALTGANPALLQATCTLVNMASPTSFVINYNVNHLSGTLPTF